ncbi:hypothetical protein [Pseudomonas saponiphila]|uniref:hypothetical protein n=1 Tax=Pseudomonas saponiphila TaxID=556534 RepID=UPI00223F108B|nr:hypothetical protein [Pseudomonas saponiphila]
MDRQIVYPGQILPETTLLQMAKDAMIGNAKLAAAMLGTSTIANGFAVTPTGPASLQIVVAPGEIYSLANIDSLAFSTLPADTTHSILKQGILLDGVTLSCPAPTTTGQSINYLIQVTYQDQDSTPVLLPYYNSANPALPYSGMGNNGLTQNTSRKGVAIAQVKAGASAATGSQTTPAPDSGYVGLYVATVAFGQTTITSGNITQYSGAPLLPSGVLQSIQGGNTTYALDIGAANAYAATFFPAITSLQDGLMLRFKASNANTGASTFSPNGISAAPIVGGNHSALQGGEIVATGVVWVQWNSTIGSGSWVLVESSGGGLQVASATKGQHATTASQAQTQGVTAFTSGGVSTALTLAPVPAISAYAAGQRFRVKFSQTSTGTDTLNVSGLGAKSLKQYDYAGAKIPASFGSGQLADVEYDGSDFVVLDQLPASAGIVGTTRNGRMFVGTASATANYLADEIVLETSLGGQAYRLPNFNKTINLATTGVGGMDTGTAPASSFVGIYAIYNPATNTSGLLAVNATGVKLAEIYAGANMPSGYTASCLLIVVPTTAGSLFAQFKVYGRKVSFLSTNFYTTSSVVSSVAVTVTPVPLNALTVSGTMESVCTAASELGIYVSDGDLVNGGMQSSVGDVIATGKVTSSFSDVFVTTGGRQLAVSTSISGPGTPTFKIYASEYKI